MTGPSRCGHRRPRLHIVCRGGAHVCVTQNSLDHHVRHTKPIPETTPRRVPAVPFRNVRTALVFVFRVEPANIMVSKEGVFKIVDFGIGPHRRHKRNQDRQIMGSLSYMAPEQGNGSRVDARTDIFSTGVVLYEVFTSAIRLMAQTRRPR